MKRHFEVETYIPTIFGWEWTSFVDKHSGRVSMPKIFYSYKKASSFFYEVSSRFKGEQKLKYFRIVQVDSENDLRFVI